MKILWWLNPRNWLGETWKQESIRRIQALEGSVQEAHLRINSLNNALNTHTAVPPGEPEPDAS